MPMASYHHLLPTLLTIDSETIIEERGSKRYINKMSCVDLLLILI